MPSGTAQLNRPDRDSGAGSEYDLSQVDRSGAVPVWGQVIGGLLLLVFVGLSIEAYFGPGLRSWLLFLGPGSESRMVPTRVLYELGPNVQIGQKSVGSQGQARVLQEGDALLLGSTGQMVRLETGGRVVDFVGVEGATTMVANLGAWDRTAERLAGAPAQYKGSGWVMDSAPLQSVGAVLHPPGAPSEALTEGYWLGPDADVGRVRRVGDKEQPAVRLRASRKTAAFMLETRQPLPTLDGTLVSVSATVRGQHGKRLVLNLEDVVDAGGTTEALTEQQSATEEWTRLTVRRRVVYPSPSDRISVGLVDADAGDWFEVRDVEVFLGVVP